MEEVLKQILGPGGALVLALFILFGGFRGWWVYGREYRIMVKDRDEWKDAALKGSRVAERAVDLAHKQDTERKDSARHGPV